MIVNRAFVDYYRLGDKAVGHRFKFDPKLNEFTEIVGVVADSKYQSLCELSSPAMFFPLVNDTKGQLSIVVRTRSMSNGIFSNIRQIVNAVDSKTPIVGEERLSKLVFDQYFDERAITTLCSLFSLFALALSCMGIYGVFAYSVTRRTQEIGVRYALGVDRLNVTPLFLKESGALIVVGLAVGLPVGLSLVLLVRKLLFGVEPVASQR